MRGNMKENQERQSITGEISVHRRGYGFLPSRQHTRDIFIGSRNMNGAMDGDTVEVELLPWREEDDSQEGIVRRILQRRVTEIAGRLEMFRRYGEVTPEGGGFRQPVRIKPGNLAGARPGDHVAVTITRYPDRRRGAEGKVTEILASADEPGGDIRSIARCYGLNEEFPGKVFAEARIAQSTGILDTDREGRRDLRDKLIFTIDGADAKDFDDAVSLEKLDNGNCLLGVHIADVAHYVREGSPLDGEARRRGTSVYLLDQVIPMLPRPLSNGICSLQPGEERLTMTLEMEIDPKGEVVGHEICESIICSSARLVYADVSAYFDSPEDPSLLEKNEAACVLCDGAEVGASLGRMLELSHILREKRDLRGSIDFDLDEARISLDDQGMPVSVVTADRGESERLIEDFMILANETIAEHFFWMEAPFIYRVHDKPAHDKMEGLRGFLREMGIAFHGATGDVHPKTLRDILDQVRGATYENVVNAVILRSMQKACYSPSCRGHFGLASTYYCHFTSPIRRYPDLFIHRIIKMILRGDRGEELEEVRGIIDGIADSSSVAERNAVEAEREVDKLKKTEYMSSRIGEEYTGIISGVSRAGFFVQLENTIEGIVRITELYDDYYDVDQDRFMLVGRRTGRTFRLGDSVRVIVESVDIQDREIRFVPA